MTDTTVHPSSRRYPPEIKERAVRMVVKTIELTGDQSAVSRVVRQLGTLDDVKNLLGHTSIVLTSNTYGHMLEQRQREVARGMDAVLGG